MLKLPLYILLIMAGTASMAQDTVSVMYYNLLNFPQINSGRISHLETITHHVKPDIFVINELTSSSGANTILANALNTQGITYYSKAAFVNSPDTENMLYYNSNKFGLLSQSEITTSLRDISEYVLYYKEPGMTAASDTIYFYIYGAHLKAGNNSSDAQDRDNEVTQLKNHLAAQAGSMENVIVGGDFNIYTSFEAAFSNLLSGSGYTLIDPINANGNYNNNAAFSDIHTQSTRTTEIDGGATGGMDDRFDYILHSVDISTGLNKVTGVPSTYWAVGQDGLHFNDGLLDLPNNTTVPSNVLSALYYMSDHLPIYMEFALDVPLHIPVEASSKFAYRLVDDQLHLNFAAPFTGQLEVISLTGSRIASIQLRNASTTDVPLYGLAKGIYFIKAQSGSSVSTVKVSR